MIAALAQLTADAARGAQPGRLAEGLRALLAVIERDACAAMAAEREPATGPALLPGVPERGAKRKTESAADVQAVYEYWKIRTGHLSARLLPERARIIGRALKDFTVLDLLDCVDGCLLSEFHHEGANDRGEKYDWVENIMTNGMKIEKHIARLRAARGTGEARENPEAAKLRDALSRAQEAGDVATANELNRRLAQLLRESASRNGVAR